MVNFTVRLSFRVQDATINCTVSSH